MSYQRKIDKIRKEEAEKATTHATMMFSYALRKLYKFGAGRLSDVLEYVDATADDLENGILTMEDIFKTLGETGLTFILED